MTKLEWDQAGERTYETGVSNGVLYVSDGAGGYAVGVPWNGLTGVTESPSGGEPSPLYADNMKYLTMTSAEDLAVTVEAYTYPDEFAECDGSKAITTGVYVGQQSRKTFGLVYKTKLGDDLTGDDAGYKLHVIYGAQAKPSERPYKTVNDSPEAIAFSWELSTTPVSVTGFKPTAIVTIVSTDFVTAPEKAKLALLEDELFGDATTGTATLLLPDAIAAIVDAVG